MKAVILHGAIPERAPRDELDTLVQVDAIRQALGELGHEVSVMPFSLNLQEAVRVLRAAAPDLVFNLVESVEGSGRLVHLAPSLLDFLGLPYTGAGTEALFLTSNKLLAKRALRTHGIATPPWYSLEDLDADGPVAKAPYIIKSVWEHASVGLDEDSVLAASSRNALRDACLKRSSAAGGDVFAEAFIDGREFNLALLAGEDGPQVLPPAEIQFVDYAPEKWKVVGYRAKWEEGSFEFGHTPRRFDFPPDAAPLLDALGELARRCWRLFGLRGYARVDFRVDAEGTPYVLEVNANPCLSPDAGYADAMTQTGITFAQGIERILHDHSGVRSPRLQARMDPSLEQHSRLKARTPNPPDRSSRLQARVDSCMGEDSRLEARTPSDGAITFRDEVTESDRGHVRRLLESTGMFYPYEVEVAVELVDERLQKGLLSGYHFLFAERAGEVVGYSCYGPIACTAGSYDLFWIAVDNRRRGWGLGRQLIERTEALIAHLGGRRVYAETSGRDQYEPTRTFYLKCGYTEAARLGGFYGPGDDKIVYAKALGEEG